MCTVDKMLIKGIRSFSPENNSVICFFKPLTLIVGPNGAGKTTIIECLKHATTGELPPNARSGHSFIHDPKVAGETETKGQIKLRFKTASGKDVVCIRSFQLTQKAAKLEYKAIESVLQTINPHTGEKVCLSYRCADMDREVPLLMGVSKAILENVIFVHQDEANWPLAEGAVLKKKFDDIFSATKYTKALETLKKVHKEQAQQIKELKLKLEHLRTLRDAAMRLQSSIDADKEKIAALQAGISELETKISEARQRQAGLEDALRTVRGLEEQVKVKESRREMLARQKIQQYNDLEVENEDTDEELQAWQQNFDAQVAGLRLKIAKAERDTGDARLRVEALKEQQSADIKLQGRLQADAEVHNADCRERDSILRDLFERNQQQLQLPRVQQHHASLLLPGTALPLPAPAAASATEAVLQFLDSEEGGLIMLKTSNKEEVGRLSAEAEQASAQLLKADAAVQLASQRKKDIEAKLAEVQASLGAAELSDSELRRAKEKEERAKEEMERAAAALRERKFESAVEAARTELFSVEQKLKGAQRERDTLAAESADRVSLRLKKDELKAKEQAVAKLATENAGRFEKLLGAVQKPPDAARMVADLGALARTSKGDFEDLDRRAKLAGNDVAALSMRLEDAKKGLQSKERMLQEKKTALSSGMLEALSKRIEEALYEQELQSLQASAEKSKKDHDTLTGMRMCFARFAMEAEARHCCPACERPFSSDTEVTEFVRQQEHKQETSGRRLQQLAAECAEVQAKASWLERLRPVYLEYQMLLEKGIPEARRTVEEVDRALNTASETHEDLLGTLAESKAQWDSAEQLLGVAKEMERAEHEARRAKKDVEEQEYKLDALSQNLRSMADITADVTGLEEKRDELSRKVERMRDEQQQMKEDVAGATTRWRNAREERTALEHRMARALQLKDEGRALEARITVLQAEIEAEQQKQEPLRQAQSRAIARRDEARGHSEKEEAQCGARLRELQRDVDRLKAVVARIEQHVASDKAGKLAEVTARLERTTEQQTAAERQAAEQADAVGKDQELLRSQALVKRNIDDNVAYRKTAREEAAAAAEVEALQTQLVSMGVAAKLGAEAHDLGGQIQDWLAEQNRSRGTLQAHEGNISRNKQELRQAQYKEIESRFRKQLIQLKTTEMANKDLDKYYSALDKALMRFHSLKMEEINKIVKELWQQTYRGLDIDFIEIRSDADTVGSRSYSYRVVMRSGDAELDMRGRCSAGQKVLASLIIRLALAETFCLNCGILALDEPTTNLDTPNAESLAAALLRLMEERRNQENFQLIVITHDERFAQLIGQKQFAEHYYRVSKDDQQRSKIELQDIFE